MQLTRSRGGLPLNIPQGTTNPDLWPVDLRTETKNSISCATRTVGPRDIFKAIGGSKEEFRAIEGEWARGKEEKRSIRGKGSQLPAEGNPEIENVTSKRGP